MIARQWRGLSKKTCAEGYVEHLRTETFPGLSSIPGFVGGSILRRDVPPGVEFIVETRWASLDAIRSFAGTNAEQTVVPVAVHNMMIEYDRVVRHYEIVQ
jgi:heme-degrading monooxygenase HmoA